MANERTEVTTVIDVDNGPRNRVTVFFRLVLGIPAAILLSFLTNASSTWDSGNDSRGGHWHWSGGMVPTLAIALLLLVMGAYPQWLLTFVHAIHSFSTRLAAYMLLLRDEYPNVYERPYAHVIYPDIEEGRTLSRSLPLVKWLLAIPHYIVIVLVTPAIAILTFLAWISIVTTGRYPASFASFVIWYIAYANRVYGYAIALVTDDYPRLA
jgi:hypothetical protein